MSKTITDEILRELLPRLKNDFNFKDSGDRFTQGTCPNCKRKELYTFKEKPYILKCGRLEKCGAEIEVKSEYPDLFDDWSSRFKATEKNPTAAADAYLQSARGLEIKDLQGAYSQEYFKDHNRNIGSATVRFKLPNGAWWERLIDQPGRFDSMKARFAPKNRDGSGGYKGFWWAHPKDTIEILAKSDEIWIAEGIFDALALRQVGKTAVSAMTVYNYCTDSLAAINRYLAENNISRRPTLVFAYDIGKAGADCTIKHVAKAKNDGWDAIAAQPAGEEQHKKQDWNDLLLAGKLENWDEYLWLGELLLAENPQEKMILLSRKITANEFPFTFNNRTYWAKVDAKEFNEIKNESGVNDRKARELALNYTEIANCKFRFLYFQRDTAIDETNYYLEILTSRGMATKDRFSGSQIAASGDFKKRLLSVGAGTQWTGSTQQLERLVARGTENIKTVLTLDFTGYAREYNAYVMGDFAVQNGRVFKINSQDYFDLRGISLKLRTLDRICQANYDAEKLDKSWQSDFWNAFREKGIVTLAFWIMSLFAEQIREKHSSLPFFEISGEPGSGKSLIIEFLWKLFGRDNYEGFDPTKATAAAIARNLGRVGNLPVVLIEGDRDKDIAHSKRFEWDELKTAYNGRSVRSRGVKNAGNETYEPPFRGAIVIAQNYPVEASPALMERIMAIQINKEDWWNYSTKNSADQILAWDAEKISGTIIHIIKKENEWLNRFFDEFIDWENRFTENDGYAYVKNQRIRKNHAQLHAAIDACFTGKSAIFQWLPDQLKAAHELVDKMAKDRDLGLKQDHPIVAAFWEQYDYLNAMAGNVQIDRENKDLAIENFHGVNHSRHPDDFIAINLQDFEAKCKRAGIACEPVVTLKKHLKSSKSRPFVEIKTVNSICGKSISAWIFKPTRERKKNEIY